MINAAQIRSVLPVASAMDRNGYRIVPIAGTPMERLMQSTEVERDFNIDEVESALLARIAPQKLEASGEMMPSENDYVQGRIVELLSNVCGTLISNVRNTVIPAINTITSSTEKYVADKLKPLNNYLDIQAYVYPEIWNGRFIESISDRYSEAAMPAIPAMTSLPEMSSEQLAGMLVTGSGEFDEYLKTIETNNPGITKAVYDIIIRGVDVSAQDEYAYIANAISDDTVERKLSFADYRCNDVPLITYALANGFLGEIIPGTGLTAQQYEMMFKTYQIAAGVDIKNIMARRSKAISSGIMIMSMPSTDNWRLQPVSGSILVNSDVYETYLTNGGTPEAVIGNAYSDRTVSASTINGNREKYEDVYNSVVRLTESLNTSRKFTTYVQGMLNSFTDYIRNMDDNALPLGLDDERMSKQELIERVNDYVGSIVSMSNGSEIEKLITDTVTDVIYPHYNARRFIKAMTLIAATNKEANDNPRLAASYAMVDVLLDSFIEQVNVNKV